MIVLMVRIGIVFVTVPHCAMSMQMGMRLVAVPQGIVRVLMMRVV